MSEIEIEREIVAGVNPPKLRRRRARAWDDTLYRTALEWVHIADATFQEWPTRPNCGHFYAGSYWYGSETAHTVLVLAALAAVGPYDAGVARVERDQLVAHAIAGIRYLGFTHDSGPEDCVRVKGPNPHASERKWGGAGDSFFQASQHGTPVAALGQAAWLLWDRLDDETRQLVLNVVSTYADTWCEVEAASGVYGDTQTEENGWTGQALGLAAMMLRQHPRAGVWKAAADRWVANICTTPYDCRRNLAPLQGKAVAQWMQGITTHPDFTAENHGFVHPNYMGSGIVHAGFYAQYCWLAGQRVPEVVRFNREPLYETLKSFAEPDGSFTPVQGQDWWYVTHYGAVLLHAIMNLLFEDPEAAYLERRCAQTLRDVAASVGEGHLFIQDPERARLNQYQSMRTAERGAVASVVRAYLCHCLLGDGVEPVTQAQFQRARRGTHTFPHGGVVTRRGKRCFASLSWRNRPTVLVQPAGGSWDITPHPLSLVGSFRTEPEWDGGIPDAPRRVEEDGETLSAVMELQRQGGRLLQKVALVVPSDDIAFYFDHVTAASDVRIIEQRAGEVSVRNEDYRLVPRSFSEGGSLGRLAPGKRRLWTGEDESVAESRFGGEDEWLRWPSARWINVDDRIGYVVFGGRGIAYQACHDYPQYKGLEDFLILSHDVRARDLSAGQRVSSLGIVIAANQKHRETAEMAQQALRPQTPRDADALLAGDWLAIVNFAPRPRIVRITWQVGDRAPVFEGATTVKDGKVTLRTPLPRFGARALRALAEVPAAGSRSAVGASGGEVFVTENRSTARIV
jgi:hypothetical protein